MPLRRVPLRRKLMLILMLASALSANSSLVLSD